MTTTEKNKCIAEMLGWKIVQIPIPDFDNKVASSPYRVMEDRWEHPVSKTLYKCLKFDTDANWQFEAIDWIEEKGWWVNINYHERCVYNNSFKGTGQGVSRTTIASSTKEAIFEALYQFSQYIKGNGSK